MCMYMYTCIIHICYNIHMYIYIYIHMCIYLYIYIYTALCVSMCKGAEEKSTCPAPLQWHVDSGRGALKVHKLKEEQ